MDRLVLVCVPLIGLVAGCKTEDVTVPQEEAELYPLRDVAFAEYLDFLEVPGIQLDEADGVWYIDINAVDGVAELPLSKTSSSVEALQADEVATAEQKIVDVDGIQYFVNLESLRITANDVEQLDVSELASLRTLEMNFNLVGDLDLTANLLLDRLRYEGSAQADEGQKLTSIDLSGNPALRHLSLPDHELVTIDLSNNPMLDDELNLCGNPGPDGNLDTPDIVVPAAIYDQVPEELRCGVVSDADVGVLVSLITSVPTIDEAGGEAEITASLNIEAEVDVTVELGFLGSATEGEDFSVGTSTLTIPAGARTAQTTLVALDDVDEEGIEIIEVEIASASGADLGTIARVEISIDGDDLDPGIVLNEVLYDPSNEADTGEGLPGDANGDGVYVQDEDEFVELVNTTGVSLDLSGWSFWDTEAWADDEARHVVPESTVLAAGQAYVLFGGGSPTGEFGGALVETTTTGAINLNNAGDLLRVTDADGRILVQFDVGPLSNNPNESYTRNPDLTGAFEQHATAGTALFSPGTRIDGAVF